MATVRFSDQHSATGDGMSALHSATHDGSLSQCRVSRRNRIVTPTSARLLLPIVDARGWTRRAEVDPGGPPPVSNASDEVVVDRLACQKVASVLASTGVPEECEEVCVPLATDVLGNFYLGLVAICHQTQALRGRIASVPTRGWDYLHAKWLEAAMRDAKLLAPETWACLSAAALAHVFADSASGNTLTDVEGRASLVNDLGRRMLERGWWTLCDLYELSSKRIATGDPNLVSLLGSFRAYNDPLWKKSFFLLGLMRNSAGWVYADRDELGAPVDYHEVRGHLRLGTVIVNDFQLRRKLLRRVPVQEVEDIALRTRVGEAIRLVAEIAGVRDCMRLHYLFWNLFRSVCLREAPCCHTPPPGSVLPTRYAYLVVGQGGGGCPFATVCPSADLAERYVEHAFKTDWY